MSTESFEVVEATIEDVHAAFESGDLTCRGLVDQYLARIEAYDSDGPELNAIVNVNPTATERAEELDRAFEESGAFVGPLHGIPVVVKDQAETADVVTTFGSEAFVDYLPKQDATAVSRLRDAGAVILAKTNLPDWATSWFGYSSVLGRTKNPYALDRDPGGSSSGTGAAVAANFGTVGIGEDTGGSIRVPASFNNLVGVRVTPGLISRTGMSALVNFQDTAGPMTRTVTDAARLLDALVGYDAADPFTAVTELTDVESYTDSLGDEGLEGARIGVLRDAFGADDDPDAAPVNEVVDGALTAMTDAGATLVDPVSIPNLMTLIDDTSLYILQSRRDLDRFLAERPDAPVGSAKELYEDGHYHELLDLFVGMVEDGPDDPESDPDYWRKVAARETFERTILTVFADHDLDAILCPDVQVLPPTETDVREGKWTTLTFPTNTLIASQSNCCAVSLPAGLTDDGIPVGVELVGKPYDEPTLLSLASAFEQVSDARVPPETTPPL